MEQPQLSYAELRGRRRTSSLLDRFLLDGWNCTEFVKYLFRSSLHIDVIESVLFKMYSTCLGSRTVSRQRGSEEMV